MPDWDELFAVGGAFLQPPVRAETFVMKFGTASSPVLLSGDDGHDYVVKSKDAGRMVITDQVVGRVGNGVGAPVPEIALILVPAELIAANPDMQHMTPGIAHGSRWIANCSDRMAFEHAPVPQNRDRFSRLAYFYGWVVADDRQFIYENDPPHLVHSVDHGHFLPGSTQWTVQSLTDNPPAPVPDAEIVAQAGLTADELSIARDAMTWVTDQSLAVAVCAPPVDWGFTDAERKVVADYLSARRDVLWDPPAVDPPEVEERA